MYGAFVLAIDSPAHRAYEKIRSAKLQTMVPMRVIDKGESGEEATLGFTVVAMWAGGRRSREDDIGSCGLPSPTLYRVYGCTTRLANMH